MSEPARVQIILPERSADPLSETLRMLTAEIERITGNDEAYGLGGEHGYGANIDTPVFTMRRYYWGDCDCGFAELEHEWGEQHKHATNCYWTVSRALVEGSYFVRAREAALAKRDKSRPGPDYDRAQKEVERVYRELDAFETKVRKDLCKQHGIPWNGGIGSAVHCTCDHDKQWAAFLVEHPGHADTCSLHLPNFVYKPTGFAVRWYKWIGRDNETRGVTPDIIKMLQACVASIPPAPKDGEGK